MCFKQFTSLPQEYWKTKISEKIRNTRKRRDRNVPAVVAMRVKKQSARVMAVHENNSKSYRKQTPAYMLKNYVPIGHPISEDEASIEKHILLLQKENKKEQPNPLIIQASMDATFCDRRQRIVKGGESIAKLTENYPCLFDSQQVS